MTRRELISACLGCSTLRAEAIALDLFVPSGFTWGGCCAICREVVTFECVGTLIREQMPAGRKQNDPT